MADARVCATSPALGGDIRFGEINKHPTLAYSVVSAEPPSLMIVTLALKTAARLCVHSVWHLARVGCVCGAPDLGSCTSMRWLLDAV